MELWQTRKLFCFYILTASSSFFYECIKFAAKIAWQKTMVSLSSYFKELLRRIIAVLFCSPSIGNKNENVAPRTPFLMELVWICQILEVGVWTYEITKKNLPQKIKPKTQLAKIRHFYLRTIYKNIIFTL